MAVRRNAGTTAVAEPEESFEYAPEEDAAPSARSSSVTRRGWDTAKKVIAANKAAFANDWSLPEDEVIVKFLEDEPFWSIGQHWIDQIREGKKSFYCIADEVYGEGCPLCDFGDRPRALSYFNVMPINGGADAFQVKALKAGPMLTEVIQKHHENTNRGPIDRHFWAVSVSKPAQGKRGKVSYNVSVVKERDLVDDYEMDVSVVRRKIKEAKLWTEADFTLPTVAELEEIRDVYLDV